MKRQASVRTHSPARGEANGALPAVCPGCGNAFNPSRSWSKYCSENCRKRAWDKQQIIRTLVEALNRVIEELQ